ncbi:hypothetical protein C6499_19555 [Candidatus Poribacteria bacterium]|nr:MAG: hypothetical protein C6499_19555 [Candidatus Poribacteria bacterium]
MKIANKRGSVITKLGISCVVCLLLGFGILLYAQEKTKSEFIGTKPEMDTAKIKKTNASKMLAMAKAKEQAQPQRNRSWGRQNRGGSVDFGENVAFYKTIIDHNLFRPLGWTPPNNEPSYNLISTAVNPNGAISQATLLEKRSNRYHFVTIGTKLGDMTVKDIEARRVILDKAGETITLKTSEWQPLTAKRERGGDRDRGESNSERASNNEGQNRANQAAAAKRRQMEQQKRSAAQREKIRREIMEKMRHASSDAERKEIMEYYKKEFGGKSGGDRDK